MRDYIVLDEKDNVATALTMKKVPFGFKFALKDLAKGDLVLKYGNPIGRVTSPIAKGQVVHVQNMESLRGRGDLVAS